MLRQRHAKKVFGRRRGQRHAMNECVLLSYIAALLHVCREVHMSELGQK